MSALDSHRSLKTFFRNAATISLFASGIIHQFQTAHAAAVSLTSTSYSQNFDSASTASLPTGWFESTTKDNYAATALTPTLTTSLTGTSGGAGMLFKDTSADQALGFLGSGSFSTGTLYFAFTNNTGSTINAVNLSWNYEKYRSGTSSSNGAYTFFTGTSSTVYTAQTSGNLSLTADLANTTTYFASNEIQTAKSLSITGLSLADGATYYMEWVYKGGSNSQAWGIDDFSLTATLAAVGGNYWNGANGAWSSSSTNWATATAGGGTTGATQATSGALIFDHASDAVTVNDTVTVNAGLTFGADGITLSTGTGTPLINLAGASAATNALAVTNVSDTAVVSVKLTGSNGFTKSGNGKLILSGDNSGLTGVATLSAGTLRATVANALGGGTLSISGGTLELSSNLGVSFNRNTTISGDTTIKSDRAVTGAGATQTLGTLSIGSQTLTVDKGSNVDSGTAGTTFGAVTLTGAPTFTVNASSLLTLASITGTAQNITINGAGDTTVSGSIDTTSGSLTKSGNGTLTLNGGNTFTGGLTINAGTVTVGSTGALNSNNVTFGSGSTGTLSLNGNNATIAGLNTNATPGVTFVKNGSASNNATLTIGNASNTDSTYAGTIQDGGAGKLAITKAGSGTLTLTGANTYTGGTTITQGKILLNGGSLAAGTVSISSGASLAASGVASAGSLSLVTGATVDLTSAGLSLSGGLTATGGNLNYTLGNTLAVTGALTLSSTVNISLAGTFVDKTRYTLLTFSSSDASNLNVTTTRLGWTITPVITATSYSVDIAIASASLNWNLSGDGTWDTSTAANWYNNTLSRTQAYADGDNVTFNQSTGGVITISGTVTPAGVTVDSAGDYTFQTGTLAGDGGITKSGNGKLTLSAANTFNGEVVVNAGTLAVTHANALGVTTSGTKIISGATLDVSNNITLVAEPLTLAGTGVAGVGALTSSSGVNTVSGPITLNGSTLITSQGISGLDSLTLSGSLSGSSSTLSVGGDADTIISGSISGTGLALNKTGTGILTLSGTSNNYTGGTTISGGTLVAGTTNLSGNITANAVLQLEQTADGSFTGNISGTGELVKKGTGSITLSGTNTVSTVSLYDGTLVMASPLALPSTGAVNVNEVSTLTLSTAGTYGASTQTLTLIPTNGNTVALTIGSGNAVTLSSNLAIKSESQIAVPGAAGVLTLNGILSGTGKLVKTDVGQIIISGTSNSFTGSTEIRRGTLTINSGSTFGTGTLTMNAIGGLATLELNESATVSSILSGNSSTGNSVVTIASGKTLTINESATRTYGTAVGSNTFTINGAGGLTMAGSGELILDSANSYSGLTSVTAGTLTANVAAAISSTVSVSSGAALSLNDSKTLTSLAGSGVVRIADGKTFTLNNSTTQNFGGTFSATTGTAFTKSGAGTVNLSGASTQLARDITLSAGTIKASNDSALGTGTVLIGTGGSGTTGTLYVAKDKTVSNNITIGTVAAAGVNTSEKVTLLSFDLNGATSFGTSPYTTAGKVYTDTAVTSYTGLTRGSGVGTTGTAGTNTWGGSSMTTATTATGAITANQYVIFGFKSTTSGFKLDTDSILPYINYRSSTGADQVQWAYKINNGSYTDFGTVQTVGTVNSVVTTLTSFPSNLSLNTGDEITFRMAIFRNGGATPTGLGNWYLKDQTGTTNDFGIQGYVVTAFDNPAWGSGVLGIDEAGTATFTGNVTVNNTAELTATTGGTAVFKTGVISGTGSLTKTGNGTVELQGANTFTGSLTLSAGNLKVSTLGAGGAASPLGAAVDVPGSIIFNGGKLEYAGSGETLTRDFTVGNGGAGFIASGTGALNIGQDAQMDFDNTAASNRTLTLGGTTDIAVENIFNPKKFDAADITNLFTKLVKQDVNKWVVLGAGAGFVDADTTEMNVDGGELDFAMGSLGSKSKINVGSATLGWYNGNTEDVSGRIYLNSAATAAFNIPSGTVTLASALNGGAATTASLTKLGNGTLQLGAANNFSGGLNISAGTVKATTTGAVGSGTVSVSRNATFVVNAVLANKISVSSGGTLAGNGTDDDATVEEGGVLSPNADNVGMISFNKLTLNGGSHVKWQLNDATGAAGIGYDSLVVSVINLNNASSSKKIHVDVTSTGSFLHFDKTKVNKFEFAKLTTALANGVNVTDLFSIDASQFETDNNLINDHLVWSMQLSADRDVMYVTTMIPEPSTYGLGLSALTLAVVAVRRRKKKNN